MKFKMIILLSITNYFICSPIYSQGLLNSRDVMSIIADYKIGYYHKPDSQHNGKHPDVWKTTEADLNPCPICYNLPFEFDDTIQYKGKKAIRVKIISNVVEDIYVLFISNKVPKLVHKTDLKLIKLKNGTQIPIKKTSAFRNLTDSEALIGCGIVALFTGLLILIFSGYNTPNTIKSNTKKGCNIYGKIRFVDIGEDYKIRFVPVGEDLRIKYVFAGANSTGEWEIVDIGEDYKVRIVPIGEDIKVREVIVGEGCR